MSETLYERRDYPTGPSYAPAASVLPGVVYYWKRIDELDRIFYLQVAPQQIHQPILATPAQVEIPVAQTQVGDPRALGQYRAAHLNTTILGIFFPPAFLIGFPIVFGAINRYLNTHLDVSPDSRALRNYAALGWTAWILWLLAPAMVISVIMAYSSGSCRSCFDWIWFGVFFYLVAGVFVCAFAAVGARLFPRSPRTSSN